MRDWEEREGEKGWEEWGGDHWGDWRVLCFLPSNALTASNKLIIALGTTLTLRSSLKVVAGQRGERDGWSSFRRWRCACHWEHWDGSQKRHGYCIFNCSEEQSLITIIEHSGSLQTHLAVLIWEKESTKHKFLFCSLRQKAFFYLLIRSEI